jgi:adenylate cyclase
MTETRKLAAIVCSDVVGYSRLAGADEDRILARLRALRSDLIDPTIAVHNGRVVKRTGDGSIVEFRSVVDAVRCAIEVQNAMAERNAGVPEDRRIVFRIGIHLGDVVEESDGDLMGDGVNIAARLESIAEPGAICLSEDAYRQVRARLDLAVTDLGLSRLKNIAEPIHFYTLRVGVPAEEKPATSAASGKPSAGLALPDRPSIAVLPFQNMSGDPEQEYFDGMVEDIITGLSRFHNLFVIARNSSFIYRGRAVDVKQVARELGVRYVVEGSVRKTNNKVRITGQLIDAATGAHLWADRSDGTLEDIFDLQDKVTTGIVGALVPKLERAEIDRAKRKPTESLDAYDYYLRGVASAIPYTLEGDNEALRLFYRAIELDPDFAVAYGWAAWIFVNRKTNGWMTDRAREIAETSRLGRCAVELGNDDAAALCWGGFALAYVAHELDDGVAFLDRALVLNPNLAAAWYVSAWLRVYLGAPHEAIERFANAMRLSPLDPFIFRMHAGIAYAHFFAGNYDEASNWAKRAARARPKWLTAVRGAAASHALAGQLDEARRFMARMREIDPTLCISNLEDLLPLRRAEDIAMWAAALRKAGLPE